MLGIMQAEGEQRGGQVQLVYTNDLTINTKGDTTADADLATQLGKEGRENHTGSNTQTGQSHFRAHSQRHLTTLEPLHETTADGNTCHLAATTENHETAGSKLRRQAR